MKNKKFLIIYVISIILFIGITYYLFLPAINIHSPGFWIYLFIIFVAIIIGKLLISIDYRTGNLKKRAYTSFWKYIYVSMGAIYLIIIL